MKVIIYIKNDHIYGLYNMISTPQILWYDSNAKDSKFIFTC
jgi:hypothetical protein